MIPYLTDEPATFTRNAYPNIMAADNDPVLPYHAMHYAHSEFDGFQASRREEELRLHIKTVAMVAQTAALRREYNTLLRLAGAWHLVERKVLEAFGVN